MINPNRTPEDVAADAKHLRGLALFWDYVDAGKVVVTEADGTPVKWSKSDEVQRDLRRIADDIEGHAAALCSAEERADWRVQVANEGAKERIEKMKPYLQHKAGCSFWPLENGANPTCTCGLTLLEE